MQLRLCMTSAISFMQRPSEPGYLPSIATKQRQLFSSMQMALRGWRVLIIKVSSKFSTLVEIICLFLTRIGPAPIPYRTFQCSPVSLLATGPGMGFGNLNLQVSRLVPQEQMYQLSNVPALVTPKAPTVGWFFLSSLISFLLSTLPFWAIKEAEIFKPILKQPPLRTPQTTFSSAAAYCSGVLGKYPRASALVFFTINSRLVSFILNLARPPVSLVWKGESVVLRMQISTEEGSPRLRSAGLVQLQRWHAQKVSTRATISTFVIEFFMMIILSQI